MSRAYRVLEPIFINFDEAVYKPTNKTVPMMIISASGGGKTVVTDMFVQYYYHKNQKIMDIDSKGDFERAFCMFFPIFNSHKLAFQNYVDQYGMKEEFINLPVEIWHPLNKLPKKKSIPKLNPYTISIKELDDILLSFIFENTKETKLIATILNIVKDLNDDETIYDLLYKLKERYEKGYIYCKEILEKYGSIFAPENYKYNLRMEDVINVRRRQIIDVFSQFWIDDVKERVFHILYLTNKVIKLAQEGHFKRPTNLILEEIGKITPRSNKKKYQEIICAYFRENLRLVRTRNLRFISNTQTLEDIDEGVEGVFPMKLAGNVESGYDIRAYREKYKLGEKINELQTARIGEFMDLGAVNEGLITFKMPRFAHKPPGVHFFEVYKRFGGEFIDCTKEIKLFYDDLKQWEDNSAEWHKKLTDSKKNLKENKKREASTIKEVSEKINIEKVKRFQEIKKNRDTINQIIRNLCNIKENGKELTLNQIMQKLIEQYEIKVSIYTIHKIRKEEYLKKLNNDETIISQDQDSLPK